MRNVKGVHYVVLLPVTYLALCLECDAYNHDNIAYLLSFNILDFNWIFASSDRVFTQIHRLSAAFLSIKKPNLMLSMLKVSVYGDVGEDQTCNRPCSIQTHNH